MNPTEKMLLDKWAYKEDNCKFRELEKRWFNTIGMSEYDLSTRRLLRQRIYDLKKFAPIAAKEIEKAREIVIYYCPICSHIYTDRLPMCCDRCEQSSFPFKKVKDINKIFEQVRKAKANQIFKGIEESKVGVCIMIDELVKEDYINLKREFKGEGE